MSSPYSFLKLHQAWAQYLRNVSIARSYYAWFLNRLRYTLTSKPGRLGRRWAMPLMQRLLLDTPSIERFCEHHSQRAVSGTHTGVGTPLEVFALARTCLMPESRVSYRGDRGIAKKSKTTAHPSQRPTTNVDNRVLTDGHHQDSLCAPQKKCRTKEEYEEYKEGRAGGEGDGESCPGELPNARPLKAHICFGDRRHNCRRHHQHQQHQGDDRKGGFHRGIDYHGRAAGVALKAGRLCALRGRLLKKETALMQPRPVPTGTA